MRETFWRLFRVSTILLALVGLPGILACGVIYYAIWLLYSRDADPREFERLVSRTLGLSDPGGESVVEPYPITYWDGKEVTFWVPQEVWASSVQAGLLWGCEPWLVVATGFAQWPTDVPRYNNTYPSTRGEMGVWRFDQDRWFDMWIGNPPPRTHVPSAADAACRYLNKIGGSKAFLGSEAEFVDAYTGSKPNWNDNVDQARFIFRLGRELMAKDQGTTEPVTIAPVAPTNWWNSIVFSLLELLGLMPKFAYPEGFAGIPGLPAELANGDGIKTLSREAVTYLITLLRNTEFIGWIFGADTEWWQSQGPHGQDYGHYAYDLVAAPGSTIYSPISGVVSAVYVDGLGNTVVVIENYDLEVKLLHGDYVVRLGEVIEIGEAIGTEGNNGNTWTNICEGGDDCYCGTGSDCGYHVHLNLYDKNQGRNVDPMVLLKLAQERQENEEKTTHSQSASSDAQAKESELKPPKPPKR